jgi:uncharacterized protein (TIGR02611 family)
VRWMVALRDRIKAHPVSRSAYRLIVGLVGFAIAATGLALLALPGPGLLVVFIGLAILGSEFGWARRAHRFVRDRAIRWARWLSRQPGWLRLVGGAASGLLLLALAYLSLRVTGARLSGVPGWVPDPVAHVIEN